MSLEEFIITVFCWIDDQLPSCLGGRHLRQRGFAPALSDSEVITLEVAGEFLGLDADVQIWRYARRHWRAWFPGLGSRTAFAKQAANLWVLTQRLHQRLISHLGAAADPIHIWMAFRYRSVGSRAHPAAGCLPVRLTTATVPPSRTIIMDFMDI